MNYFDDYDQKYPDLIILILEYFNISNNNNTSIKDKSILGFCEQYKVAEQNGHSYTYQPQIVDRICKKLCECGQMTCVRNDGGLGLNNNYKRNPLK